MSEVTKQPKRTRRWLRFSLRSFLVLVIFLSAWLGWYLYRVERQREAVKWVEENGGTVYYDYEFDSDYQEPTFAFSQPPGPKWLHEILGVDYVSSVAVVEFDIWNETPKVNDVTPLTAFKNLRRLSLATAQVSDITPLASLTNLEVLTLPNSQVSDVTPLAGLTNLLYLHATQVSDVTPLVGLKNLELLYLPGTEVSDLKPLAGLTNLKELLLYDTQVSDLTPLAGLTNLKKFWLLNTQVSEEEIEKLQQALPNCQIRH